MQSSWMPAFSEGFYFSTCDGQTSASLERFLFHSENLGFWVRDGFCASHSALLMRRIELQFTECIGRGHIELAKVTLLLCSLLSWGPGLCAHKLCLSCWATHWVNRVWALKNRRWRHFKTGDVKAVNIFEFLFAINTPTFGLFSLFQKGMQDHLCEIELLRKYSEGSQLHETTDSSHIWEVSNRIVFIEPVLNWACYMYYLTSILTVIWGEGWNLHFTHQEVEDWKGETHLGSVVELTGLNTYFPLYCVGNVLHYYYNVWVNHWIRPNSLTCNSCLVKQLCAQFIYVLK